MNDETTQSLDQKVRSAVEWLALSGLGAAIMLIAAKASSDKGAAIAYELVCAVFASISIFAVVLIIIRNKRRDSYRLSVKSLSSLKFEMNPKLIRREWSAICAKARDPIFRSLIELQRSSIEQQLEVAEDAATHAHRAQVVSDLFQEMQNQASIRLEHARATHPRLVARDNAIRKLAYVKARRVQLEIDVDEVLKTASWWQKLNYDYPDYEEIDKNIKKLETQVKRFLSTNASATKAVEHKICETKAFALKRIKTSKACAVLAIPASRHTQFDGDKIARNALILGGLSIPVSAWNDIAMADQVYSSLRLVNGNYADMTDFDIWLDCLTMSPESLGGLAALAKGALFEAQVASNTGGTLHEHFNTPDTDIVIDGIAFQIKATDSVAYIDSVDPGIPVIATSEVAEATGAIDGGMANADLDTAVSLALGHTVVDGMDTVVDACLSSLGGLGIIATLRGINHSIDRHREGMSKAEAIEEGIGVAFTGSLKATVDLAEMGYKVATSRPSRFAGRQVLKIIERIDRRLAEDETASDVVDSRRPQR